jgi:O-antigen/teichoic acid export membrane protein
VAFAAIVLVTGAQSYAAGTFAVVIAIAIAKCIESLSDIFYGLFQLNDRLDYIGISMMLKGVLSLLAVVVGLLLTAKVGAGVVGLGIVWFALLLFFDGSRGLRIIRSDDHAGGWRALLPRFDLVRQWELTKRALPMGIVMALVALNLHMPRYFVEAHAGERALGIFSTLAYAMVAITTVVDAMGHSSIPRLSRLYTAEKLAEFRSLLWKLVRLGALAGLLGVLGVVAFGTKLLTILYGPEYSPYATEFVWLSAAAGVSGVAFALTYGITAANCFRTQVPVFVVVAASNALACYWLVPAIGIRGAALAPLFASTVHVLLSSAVILHLIDNKRSVHETEMASRSGCWRANL